MRKTQYVEPYMASGLASVLADRPSLKAWLNRIVEDRSPMYLYVPMSAAYFTDQPELREFIEKVVAGPPPAP